MQQKLPSDIVAPCGMNCGICVAKFGYTMKGEKRKHECSGCRSRKSQCAFIKQQCPRLAKEHINYCFECTDFPCGALRTLDKRYRIKYNMSMIENLEYIKKNGINQFLKNEEERWKCPSCGGVICVHNNVCYSCGKTRGNEDSQ